MKVLLLVAVAVALTACGERTQSASGRKTDAQPWQGADAVYTASGWKAGDRASWEEQMRLRAQTQNDYTKVH